MNIVCHAFPAWDGDYVKSTVELMKAAAGQGHRVLYVDYAYTWTDFFKSIIGKSHASWRRMLGLEQRLRTLPLSASGHKTSNVAGEKAIAGHPDAGKDKSIYVLSLPPVFPANFLKNPRLHDSINRLNSVFIKKSICRALKILDMEAPVVVNAFNPGFGVHLAGKLGEQRLLYYCYDEIGAAAWANRHGSRLEQAFLKKCDAVIVSSEGLLQKQKGRHDSVFLVKNGVDIDLFSAEIPPESFPEIPASNPGEQIIGYLGSVDDRLDIPLLERLFQKFPDARFLFVGRVQPGALRERLAAFPNVFLAGAYPPADLPAWVARMDVCLIPFVKNEFTAGIYPLKINEYLAAGKPVVSSNFAPLGDFSGIVAIADTPDAFEKALSEALAVQDTAAIERRRAFAGKNSWAERARLFCSVAG